MSAGRIVAAIVGAVIGLVAIGLLVAGGALTIAHTFGRDADGFLTSPEFDLDTDTHGLLVDDIELWADDPADRWLDWLGDELTVRLTATPVTGEVFLGIGPREDVTGYLADVGHARIAELRDGSVRIEESPGGAPAAAPTQQDFWAASQTGAGTQELEWDTTAGEWAAVLMRPDGSADVAAVATGAVAMDALLPIGIGLLLGGLLLLALAVTVVLLTRAPAERAAATTPAPSGTTAAPYPLRLEARLDESLSRWMWLVKWLLAVPHFVVLAFLWAALLLTTFVAGVAILFTGRYPASLFTFNVGVLRWTWRVQHYATSTIGTDRYPPFSLEEEPYPAHLDVTYPERLSRGLVLVKWWLLALPHLIIVGFFTGGLLEWTVPLDDGGARLMIGGGLIGVLVLVAGFVLLFTGAYPRGLFDLLMGLNRWVYRVGAYCLLMTDEYPPFRLDGGGSERPVGPRSPGDAPAGHQELAGV